MVIVGGGAAGLTAAIFAAREAARASSAASAAAVATAGRRAASAAPPPPPKTRVTILERNAEPGKKILLSGGTRANVLPLTASEDDFSTDSRRSALRAALAAWPLDAVRRFLEQEELREEEEKEEDGDSLPPLQGVGLGPLALERESNKFFPASNSARDVRDGLVRAALRAGAELRCGAGVARLERRHQTDGNNSSRASWRLWLEGGGKGEDYLDADAVVLAAGGSSFPKTGTDGTGYRMLAALGVPLRSPYPALTPLLGSHPAGEQLAGLTLPAARLSAVVVGGGAGAGAGGEDKKKKKKKKAGSKAVAGASRRGGFLYTHQGYSGPAVLDVSEHWVRSSASSSSSSSSSSPSASSGAGAAPPPCAVVAMRASWTGETEQAWQERVRGWASPTSSVGATHVATLLQRSGVPSRLAACLCDEAGVPERGAVPAASGLTKEAVRRLPGLLASYELPVSGHKGYALAEVTGGGVPLEALDVRTMEVVVGGGGGGLAAGEEEEEEDGGDGDEEKENKKRPASARRPKRASTGLHVCGELVDVHGRIGGFNFLWAWVSGRAAGIGAVRGAASERGGVS